MRALNVGASPTAGALTISAAKPKRIRVSAKPKKSEADKFLKGEKLLLVAAALWERLWLMSIDGDTRAITYSERVNKSQTNVGVETWMAQQIDRRQAVQMYRVERTSKIARDLLDAFIIANQSIEDCANLRFNSKGKLALERTRTEIRTFLMSFAALTRLPGAN
jgi:hypothetical protein